LPVPDETTRAEIFKIHTHKKSLDHDVDLKKLARETDNLVGSDIEFICRKAAMLAIREYIEYTLIKPTAQSAKELKITNKHFDEALTLVRAQNKRGG
jgi:transitional endoplasmic reticulum ATPase